MPGRFALRRQRLVPTDRAGISLFEVVLALVILVTSLAAIGQLIASGGRGAVKARLLTQAVFLAESKMAELVCGASPLAAGTGVQFPDEPGWTYDVEVSNGPQTDLYIVRVVVRHQANSSLGNVSFDLVRMLRDPGAVLSTRLAEEERLAAEEEAATAASSQSGSGAGSGSASGGSSAGGSSSAGGGR